MLNTRVLAVEAGKKKERKQTTQKRDGRTAHRHHTGILRIKQRGEECGLSQEVRHEDSHEDQ